MPLIPGRIPTGGLCPKDSFNGALFSRRFLAYWFYYYLRSGVGPTFMDHVANGLPSLQFVYTKYAKTIRIEDSILKIRIEYLNPNLS